MLFEMIDVCNIAVVRKGSRSRPLYFDLFMLDAFNFSLKCCTLYLRCSSR